MNSINSLFYAAIAVYVAIALVPGLNTTLATIVTPTYSVGVAGIFGVVLIVFAGRVIMSMLGDWL